MPELPEVETVRRGLAARDGRRALRERGRAPRRPALAVAEGFRRRGSKGQTVAGLGRRAKYLLADLSSGDVLLMHLGMSGSFRVAARRRCARHARRVSSRAREVSARTITWCSTCRRARPSRSTIRAASDDEAVSARGVSSEEPLLRALGPEPLGNAFDAAMLAQACARQEDQRESRAARPAHRRRARQHLCLRGAQPRAASRRERQASTLALRSGAPHPRTPTAGRRRSRRCSTTRSRPAARRCAITAHRRRARRFPAQFPRLRPRGQACPTPGCTGTIRRIVQTGRSTFFCPVCQK